jgi:hypothetical protein
MEAIVLFLGLGGSPSMQLATINDCIRNIWVFFNWLAT